MAYFSNSTHGAPFDAECTECILGEDVCPIASVHLGYNYEQCKEGNELARTILNELVTQDKDFKYIGCRLKPLLEKHKTKLSATEKNQMELGFTDK